jgi:hypothetical protein
MADICTKTEVITMAFSRPVSESQIEDGVINAVQVRYLLPILGKDFYDDVILTPASYTALLVYLKPIVAHYVRFHVLPTIFADVSNTGINKIPGNNRVPGTTEDLGSIRQTTLDIAGIYVTALTKYLNDNEALYPLYDKWKNPENRIDIAGGLIIRKQIPCNFEEE